MRDVKYLNLCVLGGIFWDPDGISLGISARKSEKTHDNCGVFFLTGLDWLKDHGLCAVRKTELPNESDPMNRAVHHGFSMMGSLATANALGG